MFQSQDNLECLKKENSNKLIQVIYKKVEKLCSKNFSKYEDLFEKFIEMLTFYNRTDLIDKIKATKVKNNKNS